MNSGENTVTLGKTTYQVQIEADGFTHLVGPRGGGYFLRGFTGNDTGVRQVISWKSGQPLRVQGNEIRVIQIGNLIEVAR